MKVEGGLMSSIQVPGTSKIKLPTVWSSKFCGFCLYGKTEKIYIGKRSTYRVGLYLFLITRGGHEYGCYQR
jgi:hypothetical protein